EPSVGRLQKSECRMEPSPWPSPLRGERETLADPALVSGQAVAVSALVGGTSFFGRILQARWAAVMSSPVGLGISFRYSRKILRSMPTLSQSLSMASSLLTLLMDLNQAAFSSSFISQGFLRVGSLGDCSGGTPS